MNHSDEIAQSSGLFIGTLVKVYPLGGATYTYILRRIQ